MALTDHLQSFARDLQGRDEATVADLTTLLDVLGQGEEYAVPWISAPPQHPLVNPGHTGYPGVLGPGPLSHVSRYVRERLAVKAKQHAFEILTNPLRVAEGRRPVIQLAGEELVTILLEVRQCWTTDRRPPYRGVVRPWSDQREANAAGAWITWYEHETDAGT